MTSTHRRWLTAAVATVGAGALTFGGAVLPAAAAETPDQPVALNAAADKYELAAAKTGTSAAAVESKEASGLISVTEQGFVYYIDPAQEAAQELELFSLPDAPEGAPIAGDPATGSRAGAPVTVYLDFDGETLEGKHWNTDSGIPSLVFAPGNTTSQHDVWAAVAEDYAPFNVNVTTTRPSDDALYKTSADDNVYGSHVIITDSYDDVLPAAAGSGGIAWLNGTGSEYMSGALVFTNNTAGDPKTIAEVASHESGHNFGLEHDGIADSDTGEYYVPEQGLWAPIMGAGYYVPVTHWSNGSYAGATNDQDDLTAITDRGAAQTILLSITLPDGTPYQGSQVCVISGDPQNPQPGDQFQAVNPDGTCGEILTLNFTYTDRADYAADTVGNDAASATQLDNSSGSFESAAVIETTSDVDVFAVTTDGGDLTADVSVADIGPNLDAKLTLTDASGAVVAEDNPDATRVSVDKASGLSASITASDVAAGTYYLAVEGVGFGDPTTATPDNANGYTDYGSLGNYTLSGSAAPFAADALVIVTPEDGAAVTGGSEIDVTGTGEPGAIVTLSVGGAAVGTATVDAEGNWTAKVTVNQYGDTKIDAAQAVDGVQAGTDTVTVTAPEAPVIAAPVITTPTEGSTTEDSTPTIGGTGVAGATVTVTVTAADGTQVFAEAVVAADGTWTVDVATELANGAYTVVATQSLNGVASDDSAAVNFTVAVPAGNGGNGDDDNLATTGSDFNAAPFAAVAGILLVLGAGMAVYARRKHLSTEG